ncbi:MAG: GntR family transcriptional regulator [Steroidobacteraceae bacterium]|nr:GntR family transcriptional regulator [Steroidobacteraceae bacterium]MDW8260824.1 GntR family transcriptional regulator [Gammaproteobacteria bacterium]
MALAMRRSMRSAVRRRSAALPVSAVALRRRPAIDPGLRAPMYAQVYATLRAWICEGLYPTGSRLPPEAELSAMFGVSRITTRQAIDLLVNERLVTRQQGRGTFVATDLANAPIKGDIDQLLRKVKRLGRATRVRDAAIEEALADEETCSDLGLNRGAKVIVASHVRLLGDDPIGYVVTYVPVDLRIKFDPQELNRNPMLTLLERKGIRIAGADQFIGATLADARLARYLNTAVGAPLVSVRLIVIDDTGRRVERLLAYYRGDHYTHHSYLTRT